MTDKVQKIEKWIKEKIACWCNESQCEVPELSKQIIEGKILALREMLSFINSLQEEPVSEDLEEAVNAYIGYAPEVDESSFTYGKRQAFKAGAEWQKEQMMSSSKSGTVQEDCQIILDDGAYIDLDPSMSLNPSFPVKAGERVKVIIMKEE